MPCYGRASSRAHEETIASKITVERGQPTLPVDPQASLRTELSAQLAVAQLALEAAIAELSRNGGDSATIAASRSQLSSLSDLLRQVGTASLSRLAEMRSEVASSAASAKAFASQASGGSANNAAANASLPPAERARAAIESVGRDLFDKHVLDDYLTFDSKADEEAYRKRERENAEAVKRALALHTPEGDRRAVEIEQRQLTDAGTHGAAASPDYARLVGQVDQAGKDLDNAGLQRAEKPEKAQAKISPSINDAPLSEQDIANLSAALRSSGVVASPPPSSEPQHGLAENSQNNARAPKTGRT